MLCFVFSRAMLCPGGEGKGKEEILMANIGKFPQLFYCEMQTEETRIFYPRRGK